RVPGHGMARSGADTAYTGRSHGLQPARGRILYASGRVADARQLPRRILMRRRVVCLTLLLGLGYTVLLAPLHADNPPAKEPVPLRTLPGVKDGGTVLLPNGWSLKPAGKQVALGDFPVNMALHPSGEWLAVLHAGYGDH